MWAILRLAVEPSSSSYISLPWNTDPMAVCMASVAILMDSQTGMLLRDILQFLMSKFNHQRTSSLAHLVRVTCLLAELLVPL